jgi:Na+/glutamate symporter
MNFLEKVFNWMLVIGLIFMFGRIITLVFKSMDIPFTTFFIDYNPLPIIVLIAGAIGSNVMKGINKNRLHETGE